jgi:hypothetical protein
MLQKKLEEKRPELLGAPRGPGAAGSEGSTSVPLDPNQPRTGSVLNELVYGAWPPAVVQGGHADYVPGLAAVFGLTVQLRTEWVEESKEEKDESEVPSAPKKSKDDEDWEALSQPEVSWLRYREFLGTRTTKDLVGRMLMPRRRRFAPSAVDALEKTLLDTIWRFGHRLELARGERMALVVRVQAPPRAGLGARNWLHDSGRSLLKAGKANAAYTELLGVAGSGGGSTGTGVPAGGAQDEGGGQEAGRGGTGVAAGGVQYGDYDSDGDLDLYVALDGTAVPPAPFRLVIQVSAEDLKAFRAGDLDREDLAKRTRVQTFADGGEASSEARNVRPEGRGWAR